MIVGLVAEWRGCTYDPPHHQPTKPELLESEALAKKLSYFPTEKPMTDRTIPIRPLQRTSSYHGPKQSGGAAKLTLYEIVARLVVTFVLRYN
jgi:hypothetical protein